VAKKSGSVSALADRYAQSLYDLACESKSQSQVAEGLSVFSKLLASSKDLQVAVHSPLVSREEQTNALAAILPAAGLSGLALNFILAIAKNGRIAAIEAIMKAYNDIAAKARGEISAEVTSAAPLTTEQTASLIASLKEKLGATPILKTKIDPSILGGLIVKVGSKMVDTSLKTHLNSLKIAMKEVG
jgi:F-type H+-transporting ATPase subunit delta